MMDRLLQPGVPAIKLTVPPGLGKTPHMFNTVRDIASRIKFNSVITRVRKLSREHISSGPDGASTDAPLSYPVHRLGGDAHPGKDR